VGRGTATNFGGAYRVVFEKHDKESGKLVSTEYVGPYQTKGAAKGQLTYEVARRNNSYWAEPTEVTTGWIEQTTGEWKRIAD
jgi:hypothetical protein